MSVHCGVAGVEWVGAPREVDVVSLVVVLAMVLLELVWYWCSLWSCRSWLSSHYGAALDGQVVVLTVEMLELVRC